MVREKLVECGIVGRPWGVKGQLAIFWYSGMCPVEVGSGEVYTFESDGRRIPRFVLSSKPKGERSIVSLKGVGSPEEAKKLCNQKLYIPEETLKKLSKGEHYCYQILGLNVKTKDGRSIGRVTKIFSTGSNDVYEIETPNTKRRTILIPAIESVVIEVNVKDGYLVIKPMEGMMD